MLPEGGLNAIDLYGVSRALDNLWRINIAGIWVPMGTLALVALLCVVLHYFKRTRRQEIRAVDQTGILPSSQY